MNNIQLFTKQASLCTLLVCALSLNSTGQTYKPGDLYTFNDGSVGVVFYVNPDDPSSGTAAALHDLAGSYALWPEDCPDELSPLAESAQTLLFSSITSWPRNGKLFTQLLKSSGVSEAAEAIDIDNGWYIPDILQLRLLQASSPILEEYFAAQQGEILTMSKNNYWSSSFTSKKINNVYCTFNSFFILYSNGTVKRNIRLVRDFPDSSNIVAYWKDYPPMAETEVIPYATTTYDALVIYGPDTVRLSSTVSVHQPTCDTVYYDVQGTQIVDGEFTAACHTFTGISGPGTYTACDTFVATSGCDSVIVIKLNVTSCAVDFTITCPPDVYDTLAFGDCAMVLFPDRIGSPIIHYDTAWPFRIDNDIPDGNLFPEGETTVIWTVTDSVCGHSETCEQHVVIVFPECPDAIDCEGNTYAGVRIGCDCWIQRNLESTKYSDCTDIPNLMGYASLLHPDTAENIAIFGRLYTFEAAVRDSADNGHGHIQGVCPAGWYLPTPEKYELLNVYGDTALRSPLYWIFGGGNNSTGFSALPAGYYNGEKNRYEGLLSETYFWSTQGVCIATVRAPVLLTYSCDHMLLQDLIGGLGYSIRCIKEKE
jgi:uncharacterized protein (TIGR02145 family)